MMIIMFNYQQSKLLYIITIVINYNNLDFHKKNFKN